MKARRKLLQRAPDDDVQETTISFSDENILLMIATQSDVIETTRQM